MFFFFFFFVFLFYVFFLFFFFFQAEDGIRYRDVTGVQTCALPIWFPAAERGDEELVRHVAAPTIVEPHVARLTLTPFLVVTARTVVLQVAGAKKAEVLARALKGPEYLLGCPAQWLRKASGRVVIVCDPEAAANL